MCKFEASIIIFREINFKLSNLRLAFFIKDVLIKKQCIKTYQERDQKQIMASIENCIVSIYTFGLILIR